MSLVPSGYTLQDLKPYEINLEFFNIKNVINGRIQFGATDGKNRNIDGQMVNVTFGAANTNLSIPHSLGAIPVGYLVFRNSNGGVIYDGTVAFDKTTITLRSTVANTVALIFILR